MKMHKIFLILLAVSLIALQGCSPGGTWFPKGSATVHKGAYSGKNQGSPSHGHGGWMASQNTCKHGKPARHRR